MSQPDSKIDSLANAVNLLETINSCEATQAIYAAVELRIPDLLANGPRSSENLAHASGAHAPSLHRLLRVLSAFDICQQNEDGTFELRPLGQCLRAEADYSLRSWALNWGRYLWPVWGNLLYSVQTGQSARQLVTGKEGFKPLEDEPERAAIFNQAMVELTRLTAQGVVRAYDFSGMKRIVDVGGGFGELLAVILKANPKARGVLFDLPHASEGARGHFESLGLAARCEFVTGDFFVSLPDGADAFVLKSIVHDWNDERSRLILGNCRRALAQGRRILLVERVVPEPVGSSATDRLIALSDLHMLVALGAQERTRAEFESLLRSAGLRLTRVIPAGPMFSILEAIPEA